MKDNMRLNVSVFTDPVLGRAVSGRDLHLKVGSKAYFTTWLRGRTVDLELVEGEDLRHVVGESKDVNIAVLAAVKIAASHFQSLKNLDEELYKPLRDAKAGLVDLLRYFEERNYARDSALLRELQTRETLRANVESSGGDKKATELAIQVMIERWPKLEREASRVQLELLSSIRETLLDIDRISKTPGKQNAKNTD